MPVGAKWTMGFVLRLNNTQFTNAIKQSTLGINKLSAAQRGAIREFEAQRTSLAMYATQAGAAFTSIMMMKRGFDHVVARAADFQEQAQGLSVLLGKATGAGEAMYVQFRKAAPYIQEFAPKEVVERMKQLAAAGYNTAETMQSMGAIFDTTLASLGEMTSEKVVDLGVNLDRAFGNAEYSMRDLLNIAVSASAKYPMTVNQIGDAMGYATEAAVQFDQRLESVLTTIGILIPVTKTASKAGTSYRNALLSLSTDKAGEFLEKWGISARNANGDLRDSLDVLADIKNKLDEVGRTDKSKVGLMQQQLTGIFGGKRGGAPFAALERLPIMARGGEGTIFEGRKFADLDAALLGAKMGVLAAGNASRSFADQMRETANIVDRQLNASLERLQVNVGERFLPMWTNWTRTLKTATDIFADLIQTKTEGDESNRPENRDKAGIADLLGGVGGVLAPALAAWGAGKALKLIGALLKSGQSGQQLITKLGGVNPSGAAMAQQMWALNQQRQNGRAPGFAARQWFNLQGAAQRGGAAFVGTLGNIRAGINGLGLFGAFTALASSLTYLITKIIATADELYNGVEKARKKEDARTTAFMSGIKLFSAWAFEGTPSDPAAMMTRLKASGASDIFGSMTTLMKGGKSPEEAVNFLRGKREAEIRTGLPGNEYEDERKRQLEEVKRQFESLAQDAGFQEFSAQWLKKAMAGEIVGADRVTVQALVEEARKQLRDPTYQGLHGTKGAQYLPNKGPGSSTDVGLAAFREGQVSGDGVMMHMGALQWAARKLKEQWYGDPPSDMINEGRPLYKRPRLDSSLINPTVAASAASGDPGGQMLYRQAVATMEAKLRANGADIGAVIGNAIVDTVRTQGQGAATSLAGGE